MTVPHVDLAVARVGLGCMRLSTLGRPDRATAKAVVRRAIEEFGVPLLDTADVYALDDADVGHNEWLIAEVLGELGLSGGAGSPDVLVATKGGRTRPGGTWAHDARPERLREACEASLRTLGGECIALYQLHAPDPAVPFEESVGELARLREDGKILAVGLSNVDVSQLERARAIVPIATVQNRYSPWAIGLRKNPVLARCEALGIVLLAYSPLGGADMVRLLDVCTPLVRLAGSLGVTPRELALAAVLRESPALLPIPGATRTDTVMSSASALSLELDPDAHAAVRAAFASLPGRPSLLRRTASRLRRMIGG